MTPSSVSLSICTAATELDSLIATWKESSRLDAVLQGESNLVHLTEIHPALLSIGVLNGQVCEQATDHFVQSKPPSGQRKWNHKGCPETNVIAAVRPIPLPSVSPLGLSAPIPRADLFLDPGPPHFQLQSSEQKNPLGAAPGVFTRVPSYVFHNPTCC